MTTLGDALRAPNPVILPLLELQTTPPLYACGDVSPFVFGGITYQPFSTLGAVSEIVRTSRAEVNEWHFGVLVQRKGNEDNYPAFQQAVRATMADIDVARKRAIFSFAVLDGETGAVIGVKRKMRGYGSHMKADIKPGRTVLLLQCEPVIGGGIGPRAAFLTGPDQQFRYPGDEGLGFASRQAGNLAITWDPVA